MRSRSWQRIRTLADAIAQRLSSLPQVSRTVTLGSLVPGDQDEKLKLIQDAAEEIEPSLNPGEVAPPPTDQQNIEALSSTAATLSTSPETGQGPGAEAARRLSGLLLQLAKADPSVRNEAEAAVVEPLRISLDQLREELEPQRITTDTIPADLKREWVTPDGRARVEVLPKGDPDDTTVLRNFVTAVLAIEPDATGPAVLLFEAGNTVVRAFIEAGIFAHRGDRPSAVDHLAPDRRCPADPGAAPRRRDRDIGALRCSRSSVELRQHHCAAAAARRRRRIQDLLYHGMAKRKDRRLCNRPLPAPSSSAP